MKLRTWFWTLLSLILIVGAFSYGANNLGKYNFYYATHMQHPEDQYPFIPALGMTNMPKSYLSNYKILNGSKKPLSVISVEKGNVIKHGDYLMLTRNGISYAFSKAQFFKGSQIDYDGITIDFSEDGHLSSSEKKKMGQNLYSTLNNMQDELKRNSDRPLINLQWIYNWYFNWLNS
ncbi:MAG: hypothetical protein ACFN06_02470 [Limosilactobacillus oris]